MPRKIVDHTVVVKRKGASVVVAPNTPFDFEASEIEDIITAQGKECMRDPVDETTGDVAKSSGKGKTSAEKAAAEKAAAEKGGEL